MTKVEVSKRLPLDASAGWPFLMSPAAQRLWLGQGGNIPPRQGSTVTIPWQVGVWRTGVVTAISDDHLTASLQPPLGWQARHGRHTIVALDVDQDESDGAAVVTVTEDGFDELGGACDATAAVDEASRRWEEALNELAEAAAKARKRSIDVNQAVLVIHGIGEQTPGDTVRALVQAAAEPEERGGVHSKPDRISNTFELRHWHLPGSRERPGTDFFEVYWADKIRDTKLSQVLTWLRKLLFRWPSHIPRALRPLWWTIWGALALATVVAISFLPVIDIGAYPRSVGLAGSALLGVISGFMVNSLGDAARYLWPHPANVAVRDAIRANGVDLLEALHARGRYHRIVVLGHSLGSVIAHDIVSHYWIATYRRHRNPVSVQNTEAAKLTRILESNGTRPADGEPGSPWSVWCEIRRNTQPWLITDLITAGSPLAHAALLLARSANELEEIFDRRELAACPPRPVDDVWFDAPYRDELGRRRGFRHFTHNAPFAVTRWTNLYFPVTGGFFGDLVGGPLSEVFGSWVVDRPLAWHSDRWRGHTLKAHSLYWKFPKNDREGAWSHIDELRRALDLNRRNDLRELADSMPREAWL